MAHFAQLDENNKVIAVNVIGDVDCIDENGNESEAVGIAFCKKLWGDDTIWKQTSYNNNIRKNYAEIDGYYNPDKDTFIKRQPYPSWTKDENDDWQPPIAMPDITPPEGRVLTKAFIWNEDTYQSDNIGWEQTNHLDLL